MRKVQALVICIALNVLLIVSSVSSEDTPKLKVASPIGGYQALQDSIKYPTLFWKAGIESSLRVTLELDSMGTVLSVHFDHLMGKSLIRADSTFFHTVINAIESVKWSPGILDDRPVAMQVSFAVLFYLTSNLRQTYEQIKRGETVIYKSNAIPIIHEIGYRQ
jgi:hypothetical protein